MSAWNAAPAAGRGAPAIVVAALSGTVTRTAAFAVTLLVLARSGGVALPVAEAAALAVPYAAARVALPAWAAGYGLRRLATSADIIGAAVLAAIALTYREAGWTLGLGALLGLVRGAADLAHESLAAIEPPADRPALDQPAVSHPAVGHPAVSQPGGAATDRWAAGGPLAVAVLAGAVAAALAGSAGLVGAVWLTAVASAAAALLAPPADAPIVAAASATGSVAAGGTAATGGAARPGSAPPDGVPAVETPATADGGPVANGRVYRSVAIDSVVIPVTPGEPTREAERAALEEPTREVAMYRPLAVRRAGLRGTGLAAAMAGAGQAGALALVFAWVRGVVGHDAAFGLVAGALVAGACAGRLAVHAGHRAAALGVASGAGFAAAAGAVLVGRGLPAVTIVLVLVAFLAGTVFAAPEPGGEIRVDMSGVPAGPVLPLNNAIALCFAVLPLGVLVGAYAAHASTVPSLIIGGLLFLVGVVWLLGQGGTATAGPGAPPEPVAVPVEPVAARLAGVATWVAVTLVYADGAWSVDVERKDGVGEGGHEVRSADALRAIDILDLPGLREEIESALAADQERTEQETVRLREELTTIDEKMAAIREMVAWSEAWQASR